MLQAIRELGARASVIALLVVTAGSVSRGISAWQQRRATAAHHRQAGWS